MGLNNPPTVSGCYSTVSYTLLHIGMYIVYFVPTLESPDFFLFSWRISPHKYCNIPINFQLNNSSLRGRIEKKQVFESGRGYCFISKLPSCSFHRNSRGTYFRQNYATSPIRSFHVIFSTRRQILRQLLFDDMICF